MPVVQWCLGLPHQGTVSAAQGGTWKLVVWHSTCRRWTWRVSHSDWPAGKSGMASSAGMAIKCAEGALVELDHSDQSVARRSMSDRSAITVGRASAPDPLFEGHSDASDYRSGALEYA